jgi:hypothetical protein
MPGPRDELLGVTDGSPNEESASERARAKAEANSAGLFTTCMPLPLPRQPWQHRMGDAPVGAPVGAPVSADDAPSGESARAARATPSAITRSAIARAASTSSGSTSVPGVTGTPVAIIAWRAETLFPIRRIAAAPGPMKTMPAASQASGRSGFSERNPYPGWIASALLVLTAAMIRSIERYDLRASGGPIG